MIDGPESRIHGKRNKYCYLTGYTGAIYPQCEGNHIRVGESGTGTQHWGHLGVGVASGTTGQDRRNRTGRCEGGKAGQPGGNYPPFVGKVLGHGQRYKEGERKDGQRRVKCHHIRDLQYPKDQGHRRGIHTRVGRVP